MHMTLQPRMYWLFFVFSVAQPCMVLTGSGISCSLTEKFRESLLPWNMFSKNMLLSPPPTPRTAFLKVLNLLKLNMTVMAMLQVIIFFTFQSRSRGLAAAKSLQSCLTLCNPIDSSPPGSTVPGILQARILEWVAISFPNAWKWKVKVKLLSGVRLLATPWTAAYQAPPPMGFSRQQYSSGLPVPSP